MDDERGIIDWFERLIILYLIWKFRPLRYAALGLIIGSVYALVVSEAEHVTSHGPSGWPAGIGLAIGFAFGCALVLLRGR